MENYIANLMMKFLFSTMGLSQLEREDYIEQNYNSEMVDIPSDIEIDWFNVCDYVITYHMNNYGKLMLDTPLDKIVMWNQFVYLIIKHTTF